ncbi:hypothetical protein [Pseudoalteromonas xiamenensis]|uniref:Uncharacterized protein n=1 Tax=Pseudoalteromonas xiamenensis TaxID=882626 RepID=A0A975DJ68_9GAMM|nr:hypothetical protein [Pseudoalteromonas xiamenensis]QTH72127.1 hypothetical protein J5O05_04360 [Pseudoalteromonas xiamenensis]
MKHGKLLLWFVYVGMVITGIGLYLTLPASVDDFPHPLQGDFRMWHGLFVFISLFSIGQIFQEHIRKQIKKWRRYPDGVIHLLLWSVVIVTGFLLYYPPLWLPEWFNLSNTHWYVSLAIIAVLPFHAIYHRPKRKFKKVQARRTTSEATAK